MKSDLGSEVLAAVRNNRPGRRTWFERLPDDVQAELLAARSLFDPSEHQTRAFVKALRSAAERRGWQLVGEKQLSEWLKSRS